jgi:hypothetical protein
VIRYREGGDPSSSRKSPSRAMDEACNDLIRLCDATGVLNISLKDLDLFPVVTGHEHFNFVDENDQVFRTRIIYERLFSYAPRII